LESAFFLDFFIYERGGDISIILFKKVAIGIFLRPKEIMITEIRSSIIGFSMTIAMRHYWL
jgi:hypothetical protein